jgi:hypothetical protein
MVLYIETFYCVSLEGVVADIKSKCASPSGKILYLVRFSKKLLSYVIYHVICCITLLPYKYNGCDAMPCQRNFRCMLKEVAYRCDW